MTAERSGPAVGYRGDLPPSHFNMARYAIGRAAAVVPDKTALLAIADPARAQPEECWSYRALETTVLTLAGHMAERFPPGERVLIRLGNSSTFAIAFFAVIAAGRVAVPVSSQLTEREAAFVIGDCAPAGILADPALPLGQMPGGCRAIELDEVRRLMTILPAHGRPGYAATRADDPAYLIYTSGTTAEPKGVLHAQRAAWGRRPMYQGWYGIGPGERMLHAGAFNWTYTLGTGLTDPWANGATALVYTGPKDPALWPRLIATQGATMFAAVPSLYRQILKYADLGSDALTRLRHGLTAGETLTETVAAEWLERTGRPLYEALGMSEISTYISSSPGVPRRPGTAGRPQPGRSIAILAQDAPHAVLPTGEAGLLAVHCSDPGLMLGYWNRPEEDAATRFGDWFAGGDLATIDGDGYVTHHGRADDIMNAMGYRVSPLEVESVLATHPGVAEAACAEVRVRDGVSIIAAFVVPRDGASRDGGAILDHARRKLAGYKVPREIVFLDALPRTANGKVMRRALALGSAGR